MNNTKADCYGQKLGHNYIGGVCFKCGGEQTPFKKTSSLNSVSWNKPEEKKQKTKTHIHSELHELVDKMRKDFGETEIKGKGSFSFYLGILKKVPTPIIYSWLAEIKDSPALDTPLARRKVFWWKYSAWKKPK